MKKVLFILTIVQNTLIGRSKKSIGNATFTTWKGKNVLKSKPVTVENPRTDAQVTQRLRMQGIVQAYRLISAAIQLGFKEMAIGKSEYNAFVSENIINATTVTLPSTVDLVPANLIVSKGTIFPTSIGTATADASDGEVTLTWNPAASFPGQSATDEVNLVTYNTNTGSFSVTVQDAARSAGTAVIAVEGMTAGDTLALYVFFTKADGSKSSDSVYATAIVAA